MDKLAYFAAERGTWGADDESISLTGVVPSFGGVPARSFADAADDADSEFVDGSPTSIIAFKSASAFRKYRGATWASGSPDTFDLTNTTLVGSAGTISEGDAVVVVGSFCMEDFADHSVSDIHLSADERSGITAAAITETNPPVTAATRQAPIVDLGEGAAFTVPARSGSYEALMTGNATLTLTPPASVEVEQRITLWAGTLASCGAEIDAQNAELAVSITASTAPRVLTLYLGGEDVTVELGMELADASETIDPAEFIFVGQQERKVQIVFAAGTTSTLDLTYTITSATGSAYLSAATLVGPSGTAGDPILSYSVLPWTPGRVWLTRDGKQDWALWGRTAGNSTDSKPDATAIGALSVTGDTRAQVSSLSSFVFEDAEPALSYEATLAGVEVWWRDGTAVDLIPAGGRCLIGALVRSDGSADLRADVSIPSGSATAPPVLQTIVVSGSATLTQNDTATYTAAGYDQYGAAYTLSGVVWSAPDGGVIDQSGNFTAGQTGSMRVAATVGSVSGFKQVAVSAAGAGVLLAEYVAVADSATIALQTEGPDDWEHYGKTLVTDVNSKSGASILTDWGQIGPTHTNNRWYNSQSIAFTWTGGTPDATGNTTGHVDSGFADRVVGGGFRVTVPVSSTQPTTVKLWGGVYSGTGQLIASLSDDSAAPTVVQINNPLATSKIYRLTVTAQPSSASADLVLDWTQVEAVAQVALAAVAVDVGETGGQVLTSWSVSPATVTVVEGAQQVFTASPRDQYTQLMSGPAIDTWEVDGGGTISADPVNANRGLFSATADGSWTVTATGDAIEGTAAVTVTNPTGDYPEITFNSQYVADAIAQPFWFADNYQTRPVGQNMQRVYLGLVAALHPDAGTRSAAAQRAKDTVTWLLESNNIHMIPEPNFFFADNFTWRVPTLQAFFAICRRVSAIYDLLTQDDRARMDTYMRVQAWVHNLYNNPAHNSGQNEIAVHRQYAFSFNANKQSPFHSLPAQLVYWGSTAAYNAELATYSLSFLEATAGVNGYNWGLLSPFRTSELVASMTSGATLAGEGSAAGKYNYFSSGGSKQPLATYRGKRVAVDPTSAATSNWVLGAAIASITPANVYIRNEVDGNHCLRTKDTGCGTGDCGCGSGADCFGHIRPGMTSPFIGEDVMAQEYNVSMRSSQAYVCASYENSTIPMLAMMMATGWWKSPHSAHDTALGILRKGYQITLYRNGHWWGPDFCAYQEAMWGHIGNYGLDIWAKMMVPSLGWPGANV